MQILQSIIWNISGICFMQLIFREKALLELKKLKENPAHQKQHKAVVKALELLETNPRH